MQLACHALAHVECTGCMPRAAMPAQAVHVLMQEQTLDAKVIIFHKRRRKNSRKTKGHRQASRTLHKQPCTGRAPSLCTIAVGL